MSVNTVDLPKESQARRLEAVPLVVYGKGVDPDLVASPEDMAVTMRQLGISEEGIASSATYFDPNNRFINNGTHYSNQLGRWRFRKVPELQGVKGDIVRITTKKRGNSRSVKLMARTWVHEEEHHAQSERKDRKVMFGHIATWGMASAGALIGHKVGAGAVDPLLTATGAYLGHGVGYTLAPHEHQARKRAGQTRDGIAEVTTKAVKRRLETEK